MPRLYTRKTDRGAPVDVLERALEYIRTHGSSVRSTAKDFGVDRMTLQRFMKNRENDPDATFGYANCRIKNLVFSPPAERDLSNHIKELAKQFHGLTKEKVLNLAYKFALANHITMPPSWIKNQKAGHHFWLSFKDRHNLSIRSPEATSLARATAFNKHTVGEFFQNLASVMDKYNFSAADIYNLDETGVHTVQAPGNVVTDCGTKQVGSVTSAERGELVTLIYAINAAGTVIPPMFIFPIVNYRDHFIRSAPNGSLGSVRSSGWVNEELFIQYIHHLIRHTRCNINKKVLVIMDNHESHISLDVIDLAKENGIVILTIPPHTSHKLQPLDRTCYSPFKTAYGRAMDNWMRSNPGKTVTIYDILQLVNEAHTMAFTQQNIWSGFKSTGIFPINPDIFTEVDFAPSSVTDRADKEGDDVSERLKFGTGSDDHPANQPQNTANSSIEQHTPWPANQRATTTTQQTDLTDQCANTATVENGPVDQPPDPVDQHAVSNNNPQSPPSRFDTACMQPQASTSRAVNEPERLYVSPKELLPLPKAGPRKITKINRRRRKTTILTNTPTRNELALSKNKIVFRGTKAKRAIFSQQSSDSEDMDITDLCGPSVLNEISENEDDGMPMPLQLEIVSRVDVSDFILCRFATKRTVSYYVAKVLETADDEGDLQVTFLKRKGKSTSFIISNEEAASFPLDDDVCNIMPKPSQKGTTKRTSDILSFDVNFGSLNVL